MEWRTHLPKIVILKGLPASGKSTKALELLKQKRSKRINFDLLREMLDGPGGWSRGNEAFVHEVTEAITGLAVKHGKDVILDNTNLSKSQINLANALKSKFRLDEEMIDFTDVDVEECIKRDAGRSNPVGADVILEMYNKYVRNNKFNSDFDPSLSDCVIVDLDGTLADHGRERSPFDWDKVYGDSVRWHVQKAVKGFQKQGVLPVFVSGREDTGICRQETERWLKDKAGFEGNPLFMRPEGDYRKDYIVKAEIYEKHIKGNFNVVALMDDRAAVVRKCWDRLGFGDRIFRVGRIDADNF